jgi:diacylglycerol kinase
VFFAPGQYVPATPQGQKLLAHELTHVLQQRDGRVRNPLGPGLAVVQDAVLEAEAERMGAKAVAVRAPVYAGGPPFFPGAPLRPRRKGWSSTIQMHPTLAELAAFSTALREHAKAKSVIEVQAMSVLSGMVVTSNQMQVLLPAAVGDHFEELMVESIVEQTSAKKPKEVKSAKDPEAAAAKVAMGGLVVLTGGFDVDKVNGLHAEQALLLVLAHMIAAGEAPGDAVVAGRNAPCGTCSEVLKAFAEAYAECGYGKITYVADPGQDRGRAKLPLSDLFPKADGKLKTFIDTYHARLGKK